MSSMNVMKVMNVLQGHQGGNSNFFPVCARGTFMTFITFMRGFWGCFVGCGHDLRLVVAAKVCAAVGILQSDYIYL